VMILVTFVFLFAIALTVQAGPPDNAQGDWFYHPRLDELELVKIVDGNTFFRTVEDSRWNGTFHGSEDCVAVSEENCAASVDMGPVVFHRSGQANFQAVAHFPSVTVEGVTGSLEMRVTGSKPDPVTDWEGNWVITGGSLHEDGLRGQGPWWGPGWQEVPGEWGIIHYSGNIHFEPN
jgi:hypothetical protein